MTDRAHQARKFRKDGIRTLADLHLRCRHDDETGCLIFIGPRAPSSSDVWLPGHGATSICKAMRILALGQQPEGKVWAPMVCMQRRCCNPKHWRVTTLSDYWSALRPVLKPDHRAAITVSVRKARGKVDERLAAQIRTAEGTCNELAALHQVDRSTISSIRRGVTWKPTVAGASAFTWRPE